MKQRRPVGKVRRRGIKQQLQYLRRNLGHIERLEEYLQRIPVEGKFGQGKNGYRLNYIRAKRADTATAWINSIFLVMNLLILLRIFFALCKKGVTVVLLPLLRIGKVLFCHQRSQLVSNDILCRTAAV
ncbi:MAG: transposase [Candidatus Thiodiazotropha sp. (ex Lucinoma borealis)]|nr:transposase [Candidatus Thiodiazotropha sp. (ex Lucinoma borealis)]